MSLGKIVNGLLRPMGFQVKRIVPDVPLPEKINRHDLNEPDAEVDREAKAILNLVGYSTLGDKEYSGDGFDSAYHTLTINNKTYSGQRKPEERLEGDPLTVCIWVGAKIATGTARAAA